MTVGQFRQILEDENIPDHFTLSGYEGEGGSWIVIEDPSDETTIEINTN